MLKDLMNPAVEVFTNSINELLWKQHMLDLMYNIGIGLFIMFIVLTASYLLVHMVTYKKSK